MPSLHDPHPPVFLPLPQGLGVSGINTWAVDLANALAARGRSVAIALHPEPPGYARVTPRFHSDIQIHDLTTLPRPGTTGPDLSPFVGPYRNILDDLGWSSDRPVVMLPSLEPDCYAVAAILSAANPDRLRVIGWQHSDNTFDTALLRTYDPMLSRIVGVSRHIAGTLAHAMPWRVGQIVHIPYGVDVLDQPGEPDPGIIRLVYAGRMEHGQKRIGTLTMLARLLHERSVPFRLTFMGDGPAAEDVDAAIADIPQTERLPPGSREQVKSLLAAADAFVLASRFEGLSIAMLECLGAGVVPIVTGVASGAVDAITHGIDGLIIPCDPDTPEDMLARAFADLIEPLARDPCRLATLRANALDTARERYAHALHTDRCEDLFRAALAEPPRPWPADRPTRFGPCVGSTGGGGEELTTVTHGTVPPDAEQRARDRLVAFRAAHPGARLAIYGTGRHTRAIANALADHADAICCVTDDDTTRHGSSCWGWPIVPLADLPARGIRDVLISSWIHAEAMSLRCLARGLTPHLIYVPPA